VTYLGATELANLRTHFAATLPDVCTISYVTHTTDGAGRDSESWTARGTAIACRLAPASGIQAGLAQETVMEGQMWSLSLDYNQTVALDDKVVHDSKTYRVIQANTSTSELMLRRAMLVRWA